MRQRDFGTHLYHNTDLYSLLGVFRDGYLGKPGHRTSLTRDRHYNNAPGAGIGGPEVRFVFSRDELRHRYKLKPHADRTVATDKTGDTTVSGYGARWESEESVSGPISLNDVLRVEVLPKTREKLEKLLLSKQDAIEFGERRLEMLERGYFWHQPRQEFVKIETERQRAHHIGSEDRIRHAIGEARKDQELIYNVLNSIVEVESFK